MDGLQFIRKASLTLVDGENAIDLSAFRFKFKSAAMDEQSPTNCSIRVYNLSQDVVQSIRGEYSRVVVQAGYDDNFGVIFDGTIRQYRIGRESGTDTYLDILAADGDTAYNFAVVNTSIKSGSTPQQRINAIIQAMADKGLKEGKIIVPDGGGILPRGKVMFGLAQGLLASTVQSVGATWSIQDGAINVLPLQGYLPGEAVVLTSKTGLIGRPEQTVDGIIAKCLINPRLVVGGTVKLDNKSINQTVQRGAEGLPGPAYNQWTGIQMLADINADGLYRVYVIEYEGDTRGPEWYCNLVLLTIDPVSKAVIAKN